MASTGIVNKQKGESERLDRDHGMCFVESTQHTVHSTELLWIALKRDRSFDECLWWQQSGDTAAEQR